MIVATDALCCVVSTLSGAEVEERYLHHAQCQDAADLYLCAKGQLEIPNHEYGEDGADPVGEDAHAAEEPRHVGQDCGRAAVAMIRELPRCDEWLAAGCVSHDASDGADACEQDDAA